ncbi:MAG: hypothetical protein LBP94_01670 [Zoogloeaceae bacterium]|nr:hypothetical protein [Zoogloeaceae bacterium]
MRLAYFLCAIAVIAIPIQWAYAEDGAWVIGEAVKFSAGPYDFHATPISFRGKKLGYADACCRPQQFSKNFWVYLSCTITPEDFSSDGKCMQWKILNARTGKVADLKLPAFESFWSVPAFSWPHVAYVEVGEFVSSSEQPVYCVIFNYKTKSIVQRHMQSVKEYSFATDFPKMFISPVVSQKNGVASFSFGFDDAGTNRTLCELSVP